MRKFAGPSGEVTVPVEAHYDSRIEEFGLLPDGRHSSVSLADRVLLRKFGGAEPPDGSSIPDARYIDGSMPDGRHSKKLEPVANLRDGSSQLIRLTLADKALLRRFGGEVSDGCDRTAVAGKVQAGVSSPVPSVVPATDNATPRLLPHAPPSPSTPPAGVNTNPVHSTRTSAARTTVTAHATPATLPAGLTEVESETGKVAAACELMDLPNSASGKRRKVAGRHRVRIKREVMDETAPEDRGAGSAGKVVSGAREGEAPEDRGASASTEMATAVMQIKAPEDRGAHSLIESLRNLTTCMLQKVPMDSVTPEVRGEGLLESSQSKESSALPTSMGCPLASGNSSKDTGDFALLYFTLVADKAVPYGYLQEFLSLEKPARRAAERSLKAASSVSDSKAIDALRAFRRDRERQAGVVSTVGEQLLVAADIRPKKFRTRLQRALYEGPTARKDAETAERERWVHLLANLLRSTETPMGKLLRENPCNVQLLGGGRRAGTLRSRVRSVKKFLAWLIASHGINFPVDWRQLTEYLQVRHSEPCVRGSLKLVHTSYIFLQEVAGIEDKLTDSAMYAVALKELKSQATPGRPPRQAPRYPTVLLAAFEETVLAGDKPLFLRVLSWWLLVQCWGTMRFDDHRVLLPRDISITKDGLQAKLTRTKVSGSDKRLSFRAVFISASAYVQCKNWLAAGWELLQKGAPHDRDYLLLAPTNNFLGFKTKELKYSTAFAAQTHIITTARFRGLKVFDFSTGHYYTPHSGRNFLPSAASVLGFSKADRDVLGGWSAEGSQRYTRTAKYKILQMQAAVAMTFRNSEFDQLAEADDIDALADFLKTWDVPQDSIRKSQEILLLRSYADLERADPPAIAPVDSDFPVSELALDDCEDFVASQHRASKEKQQAGNRNRSELLGTDHKQARKDLRSKLQDGFYISHSGKKAIRVVHKLGHCYMLPGVDYLSFSYAGTQFPASDEFDSVCKWCARAQEPEADPGSSGTITSSSSDE